MIKNLRLKSKITLTLFSLSYATFTWAVDPQKFDTYVHQAFEAKGIPGAAVAIVQETPWKLPTLDADVQASW